MRGPSIKLENLLSGNDLAFFIYFVKASVSRGTLTIWARSSVWLERVPDKDEVSGSIPLGPTRIHQGNPDFFWGRSSVWESTCFASRGSGVQSSSAPPVVLLQQVPLGTIAHERIKRTTPVASATGADHICNRSAIASIFFLNTRESGVQE